MKISPIKNSIYKPSAAKISFGEAKVSDAVKSVNGQDVTQFKAVKVNQSKVAESFFSKIASKIKGLFGSKVDSNYNPYSDNIDQYIASRVCTI